MYQGEYCPIGLRPKYFSRDVAKLLESGPLMRAPSRLIRAFAAAFWLSMPGVCPQLVSAQIEPPVSLNRIAVVGSEQGVAVKITASGPSTTEAQTLTGPDRLVIDFPGAVPGKALRGLRLNQGDIKAVRAGLFRSHPPVTRVVVDLKAPTAYRLVAVGGRVMVKLGSGPAVESAEVFPGVSIERRPTPPAFAAPAYAPEPPLRVGFDRGLLTISARKASLAEVLYQVHLTTGADIPIPSGAEQEQVVIQAGPGPAKDVLASLLNGSRFNFILQGKAQDPQGIGAVILSPKSNITESSDSPPDLGPPQTTDPGELEPVPTTPPNAPMQPDGSMPTAEMAPEQEQ
jgi:hypothetical protein